MTDITDGKCPHGERVPPGRCAKCERNEASRRSRAGRRKRPAGEGGVKELGEEQSRRLAGEIGYPLPPGARIALVGELGDLPPALRELLGLGKPAEEPWPLKPFFGQPLDFELGLLMALRRGLAEVKARNGGKMLGWDEPSGRGVQ